MKKIEELKKKVLEWSGLELIGETKDELKASLEKISWALQCEIEKQENKFYNEIEKLRIKD